MSTWYEREWFTTYVWSYTSSCSISLILDICESMLKIFDEPSDACWGSRRKILRKDNSWERISRCVELLLSSVKFSSIKSWRSTKSKTLSRVKLSTSTEKGDQQKSLSLVKRCSRRDEGSMRLNMLSKVFDVIRVARFYCYRRWGCDESTVSKSLLNQRSYCRLRKVRPPR